MAKLNFKYKNKEFHLDVKICDNYFSRAIGLMFRTKSKPLLFSFRRETKQAIHSFFCVSFFAVWFNENKIIDAKIVKPWKISVFPSGKFNKLLEIPINDENFKNLKFLI